MQPNPNPLSGYAETAAAKNDDAPALREQILAGAVYLTREAARLIRVQPSTIRQAVRTGKLRGRGRPFRILGSELLKFAGGASP